MFLAFILICLGLPTAGTADSVQAAPAPGYPHHALSSGLRDCNLHPEVCRTPSTSTSSVSTDSLLPVDTSHHPLSSGLRDCHLHPEVCQTARPPNAFTTEIGLHDEDGWYLVRLGSHGYDPGLWVLGFGFRTDAMNSTIDSVRRHESILGISPRLEHESWFKGPGPLSFYASLGISFAWTIEDSTLDRSQLDFSPAQTTRISTTTLTGILGSGLRLRLESGFALAAGMEFGPQWKWVNLSSHAGGANGERSESSFYDPTWNVGADWFY